MGLEECYDAGAPNQATARADGELMGSPAAEAGYSIPR
jgi:hypothetical protein